MDLAKIGLQASQKEFALDTAALGTLRFLYLSLGRSETLRSLDLEIADSSPFIEALIQSLARREDGTILTISQVQEMSDEERESFARNFLERNQYLALEPAQGAAEDRKLIERPVDERDQAYLWRCWADHARLSKRCTTQLIEKSTGVGKAMEATLSLNKHVFRGIEPGLSRLLPSKRLIDEITRSGIFGKEFASFKAIDFSGLASLMDTNRSTFAAIQDRYFMDRSALRAAIEGMNAPWLKVTDGLRSMTAFAELQGMGNLLQRMPTFADVTANALRHDLGDWRDRISWPAEIFNEVEARSDFYQAQGFDPALAEMPPDAFEESVEIAGLRTPQPKLVDLYGDPIGKTSEEFERTNQAHDWLMRFESELRQFIDLRMTSFFGTEWMNTRLPKDMLQKWIDKREFETAKGRPAFPLIAYADFTDYLPIIELNLNWKNAFKSAFGRAETIRESLQRLYPIRICAMHARPITQEDELFLWVEIKRIITAIRAS